MSKEATIIQSFNDVKRQYEYSVKGYDVTESVKILLKRHKEEYDKEKNIFAGIDGYLEAQKECQSQISDLEAKLAESEKFMKDNGFKNLEELDNYIQKIHLHYDEVKNKGTCGLCEKLDNEQIKELKQQLKESESERKSLEEKVKCLSEENEECFIDGQKYNELREQKDKEIQQLKQSQKQLAIEELEFVLKNFRNRPAYFDVAKQELCLSDQDKQFIDFINSRIKELG